jgi:hypothetical protein
MDQDTEDVERWLPVPGLTDRSGATYEDSSHGRIRKTLVAHINRATGYPVVPAPNARTAYVHHLVAAAFLGPRPLGQEIRHLDGNKENSRPSNLAYGTHAENMADYSRHFHEGPRATHCVNGHAYTADNIYRMPSKPKARYCRECRRINSARRWADRKAAS